MSKETNEKRVKVWCEWDMGWNLDNHTSIYKNLKEAINDLESKDWEMVGYDNYTYAEADGMLTMREVEL